MEEKSAIDMYLNDVKKYRTLPPEKEEEIYSALVNGTEAEKKKAKEDLVIYNAGLAYTLAKKYDGLGIPIEDLVMSANEGLCVASEKFDPSRNVKFGTYAFFWVRHYLNRFVQNSHDIRIPKTKATLLGRLGEIKAKNEDVLAISELAEILGISEEQAEQIKNLEGFAQTVSFDSPLDGTDSSTLGDLISDEREDIHLSVEKQLMRERVREALDDMTVEESEILRMCYGIGRRKMSTQEIAEEMFLSRRRIQQLIQKAEDHLELRLRKYFVNED